MRQRSFARAWQDAKRPLGDDEEAPRGPMVDWVHKIQARRDQAAIEDMRALLGR